MSVVQRTAQTHKQKKSPIVLMISSPRLEQPDPLLQLLQRLQRAFTDAVALIKEKSSIILDQLDKFRKSMDRNKDGKLDTDDCREMFHEIRELVAKIFSHALGEAEVKAITAITMPFACLSCLDAAWTWHSARTASREQVAADENLQLALLQLSAADAADASARAAISRIAHRAGAPSPADRQLLRLDSICLGMPVSVNARGSLLHRQVC